VTGGGRGIGRAIVDRLHRDGFNVLTCGRSARPQDLPSDILWVQADVASPADAQEIVARAIERFGGISVLVNNAGVQLEKTVQESSDEDWDRLIGTNCRGVFNMSRAVLPFMAQAGGTIVNLGSTSGFASDGRMALYNASKGFVHALTRSLAVDHGPKVRCNAISPGWIMTEMAEAGFALASDPSRAREDALKRHPVKRFGTPQDVANAVSWLISDEASFMTGQCLVIDGGLLAASPLQPGLT